jgi:hypothetical protein
MSASSTSGGDGTWDTLAEGYRQMAADAEREREAEEWCDGLVGDAF